MRCIITNQLIGHRKAYRLVKRVDIWQNTSLSMKDGCTFKLTSCKQLVSVPDYQDQNEGHETTGLEYHYLGRWHDPSDAYHLFRFERMECRNDQSRH